MDPRTTEANREAGQIRIWVAKYKLSLTVLITVAGWALVVSIYGYIWVSGCMADPGCRDYEGIWILPLLGFTMYQVPILLIGLVALVILEVVFILWTQGKSRDRINRA